jgi:hypothetical protein
MHTAFNGQHNRTLSSKAALQRLPTSAATFTQISHHYQQISASAAHCACVACPCHLVDVKDEQQVQQPLQDQQQPPELAELQQQQQQAALVRQQQQQ